MEAEEVFRRFDVSRESQRRLTLYADLLRKWQAQINLVGGESIASLWERHVADSLQLRAHIGKGEKSIIDLGSGAGLPGLVLALAYPEYRVTLIESSGKKAAFLREVARRAQIDVQIIKDRVENVDSEPFRSARPVVTARAVAPLHRLLGLAAPLLETGRALFHKGQDVGAELTDALKSWRIDYIRHPSVIDSKGVILEILEVRHIDEHGPRGD
ncbi:MAG: 16S rRNA (guanine(527)-N(7))-methyltransferase RsmG [Aestuariivirgaceae bacterium]